MYYCFSHCYQFCETATALKNKCNFKKSLAPLSPTFKSACSCFVPLQSIAMARGKWNWLFQHLGPPCVPTWPFPGAGPFLVYQSVPLIILANLSILLSCSCRWNLCTCQFLSNYICVIWTKIALTFVFN